MNHKNTTTFSSRWGFILSAVGSAVGMANVWGFPAKMGSNGGGAFLFAYLIFVALFSIVGLSAEYVIGRRSRTGTGSSMIVYGAYLDEKEDVVHVAVRTAVCDTVAALVAAMVIIPACFAYGLDVGAGPSLLFVTLPRILQDVPMGQLFAVILYTAMVFAGVSSLQNMFEAVGESLQHHFPKISRNIVLVLLGTVYLGFGLNMEPIFNCGPWMDIVSIYIIPIGATLGAISWFWVMKRDSLLEEINKGTGKPHGALWHGMGRYAYVLCAMILCCVALFMKVAF